MASIDQNLWTLRAVRADPPVAAATGARAKVFQAALEQHEQLLRASATVGAASSPLPLFYSLSQAGRAILAAHGPTDGWHAHGHGLSVDERDPIGATIITPKEKGLFQAVADVTGSPRLTGPVTLAEVWAGSPRFVRASGLGEDRPPVLRFSDDSAIRSAEGSPFLADEFRRHRDAYPGVVDAVIDETGFEGRNAGLSILPVQSFPTAEARAAFENGLVLFIGSRFLRVPFGEARDQLSGLMTWWVALIALSSLARYEPAAWTAALRPTSVLAVPLERTLDNVALTLPLLVHDALVASQKASPRAG